MPQRRTVFFVSDGTGITAQMLGHSLLTQFEGVDFRQVTLPFILTSEQAEECRARIEEESGRGNGQPIVFSTLVNNEARAIVRRANAVFVDFFEAFIDPLQAAPGMPSTHTIGRSHTMSDTGSYHRRIEAINFALAHDDGQSAHGLQTADVILVGVSRSGKTPTSLYLAMQFGVKAANYPLIPEDFERDELPSALPPHRRKLFGLSISPERLSEVRNERRPDSRYASLENCRLEVSAAERMMRREGIRWLSSTTKSIEEIAATIMNEHRLHRNRD